MASAVTLPYWLTYRGDVSEPPVPGRGPWQAVSPSLLVTASGSRLLLGDRVVVKIHESGTSPTTLAAQLRLLHVPQVARFWVPPLLRRPVHVSGTTRLATVWRRADVLSPGPGTAPWAHAATALAGLHRCEVPDIAGLPAQGGPARLARVLRRLEARRPGGDALEADASVVLAAGRRVQACVAQARRDDPPSVVHGDWHLGQLGRVRNGPAAPWLMLDVDDVGLGDPAWDLGRPAGFWAAGLVEDADWFTFLETYRAAGGPAVPPSGDPWGRLDVPARAAVVVAAARAVLAADRGIAMEDVDSALVEACGRMQQ
jgi:aminoglycoside phosphotransferase (APT) family kinase protein